MPETTANAAAGTSVDADTHYEIAQFLFREAELLDSRRFEEWLGLLADDIHYWMPARSYRSSRESSEEFAAPGGLAHFEEDKKTLAMRIVRLGTGMAWAEEPPSRTRHLITNIVAVHGDAEETYAVGANFVLHRDRPRDEPDILPGRREDVLRRRDGGLEIAKRVILIDQVVLTSKNLSMFF